MGWGWDGARMMGHGTDGARMVMGDTPPVILTWNMNEYDIYPILYEMIWVIYGL